MAGSSSQNPGSQFDNHSIGKSAIILFIIVLIGIIGVVHYYRNQPPIEVRPTSTAVTLPGRFSVAFPAEGESAVGTDNFGVIASSPDQTPIPIASVTKIMTAYLVLKAYPLKPGEDGPTLTMTAQDVADYVNDAAEGGSVLEVAEGEKLTERELLEGLLLPSGDNVARTLARWVSGSETAFVAKMNETAQALGMTQTHYADASGLNPGSISNAVDQITIAKIAMEDPVFREIVAMPQANLPVAGTIDNVNDLLGTHGIVGIKTGSSSAAGGCFVSAASLGIENEAQYIIVVVLGQHTNYKPLHSALNENAKIVDQVRPQFKLFPLETPPNGFGQVTNEWQSNSRLSPTEPVQILGYPGMTASLSINLLKTQTPIPPGENMATLKVQSGKSAQEFLLRNQEQINPPGFLWRLFRNWM